MEEEPCGKSQDNHRPENENPCGERLSKLLCLAPELDPNHDFDGEDHSAKPRVVSEAFHGLVGGVLVELTNGHHAKEPPENEPGGQGRVCLRGCVSEGVEKSC